MSEFEKYRATLPLHQMLVSANCCKHAFEYQQAIIDDLKAQLENMEQCYIEKKKQVEAVSKVLCELKESMIDFQEMDLYDKGHRVTTEYVITDLEEALRGEHEGN